MLDLAGLLLERFKVKTRAIENPLVTSVGTTATLALANNPNRLAWILVNLSANIIYIALSNLVSPSYGIYLDPNGGVASMVWDEDFQATGWAIWAIAPAGASAVYSMEVVTQ